MKKVAVLMAGGKSERLWPFSRISLPKQFLSMTGNGHTMIQETVKRLLPITSYEDIYVVTNESYVSIVKEQLPNLPVENILAEPEPKDTAPCVAFATAVLNAKYGDAVMMVLASDHLIQKEDLYLNNLESAANFAETNDALVTIGICPAYPEVGYGYIHFEKDHSTTDGMHKVIQFVEKPNLNIAQQYCASGEYLWNSGMFIWRLSVITKHFKELTPSIYEGMQKLQKAQEDEILPAVLPQIFSEFPKTSVDYAIMEHAKAIYTIPGSFHWLDVGNWNAIPMIKPSDDEGNVHSGDVISLSSKNTIVSSDSDRLIALIGLEGLVVVDTKDVLLISARDQVADIKKVTEQLRNEGRFEKL